MKKLFCLVLTLLVSTAAYAQSTFFVTATPTISTSAYADGDALGDKLTFTAALQSSTATGYVISIMVTDLAGTTEDIDLVLFRTDPAATTFTDNAALDIADADLSKVMAVVNFGSANRFAFNDNGVKYVASLAIPVEGKTTASALSRTFYGALVSRGTPTFAGTSDVSVTLGISQD